MYWLRKRIDQYKMSKGFINQMALSTPWVVFQHPAHQAKAQEFNFTVFSKQFNIAGINFSRWKNHILLLTKSSYIGLWPTYFWNVLMISFFRIGTL